jgi:phytol kinase
MSDFATHLTTSAAQSATHAGSLHAETVANAVPTSPVEPESDGSKSVFGRMSSIECKRRLLHILPGLLPTILWFIPHKDPLSWDCRAWLGLIIVGIGIATAVKYRRIARRDEASNPACILGYTIPIFFLLMVIPAHAELGLATLAIISFGDGFATVGGLLLPGPRLPWNKQKSWAGFLCFLTFALPWSAMVYWGESRPAVSFSVALFVGGTATLFAAICESVNSRIDDNIRVGFAAAVGIVTAHFAAAAWL